MLPTELSDALAGHMEDEQAEDMIQKSMRYQDGVTDDFEMANVSTRYGQQNKAIINHKSVQCSIRTTT